MNLMSWPRQVQGLVGRICFFSAPRINNLHVCILVIVVLLEDEREVVFTRIPVLRSALIGIVLICHVHSLSYLLQVSFKFLLKLVEFTWLFYNTWRRLSLMLIWQMLVHCPRVHERGLREAVLFVFSILNRFLSRNNLVVVRWLIGRSVRHYFQMAETSKIVVSKIRINRPHVVFAMAVAIGVPVLCNLYSFLWVSIRLVVKTCEIAKIIFETSLLKRRDLNLLTVFLLRIGGDRPVDYCLLSYSELVRAWVQVLVWFLLDIFLRGLAWWLAGNIEGAFALLKTLNCWNALIVCLNSGTETIVSPRIDNLCSVANLVNTPGHVF